MTSIDNVPMQPEPPIHLPQPRGARSGSSPWPRAVAFLGILACGVALGAGGAAAVATGMDPMGWRQGARLTFIQRAVARALDLVGASAAQEAKVHDIIAAKIAEVAPQPSDPKRCANRRSTCSPRRPSIAPRSSVCGPTRSRCSTRSPKRWSAACSTSPTS